MAPTKVLIRLYQDIYHRTMYPRIPTCYDEAPDNELLSLKRVGVCDLEVLC